MNLDSFSANKNVLILAPTSKDAQTTARILETNGLMPYICEDIKDVCKQIENNSAAAAILTVESILSDKDSSLEEVLKNQLTWSDFPIIALTPSGNESVALGLALQEIGNMTLISRPVQIQALISHVKSALRDRRRQCILKEEMDKREAQSAMLGEAHEYLELMLESAKDYAIISMNTDGLIVHWNEGAARVFGYDANAAIGQSVKILFTPEDRAASVPESELRKAATKGRAKDERWHLRSTGERFYVSGIMAAMYDSSKNLKGFVKIARDMTEQKQAEEYLISAKNTADAANIAKTEFLANMSHEIRTPMNAVIGLSNILARTSPLTSKQSEFIKTLQLSADSLLSLINDLLDIAKIEARTVELEQIPFSLTQIIEEVTSIMAVRVKEKGLIFIDEGKCVHYRNFVGDPTRLRQILLNLCSNAIKFTEFGSVSINVTCSSHSDPNFEIINIEVKDTGVGIDPRKIDMIFEKFVQADTSINRKYGGTGLGLAITKTLTEIMGGSIKLESEIGKGSVFTVSVPLKIAQEEEIQNLSGHLPDLFPHGFSKIKKTILLVEDYAANVIVASTFLEQFGYEFNVANNGIEAVEKVKKVKYAAILMDVQMHGMNGFEATVIIRQLESMNNLSRVPIIGMTAHALAGDRERCIAAGMDDYISKPFNPKELEDILEKYIKTNEGQTKFSL